MLTRYIHSVFMSWTEGRRSLALLLYGAVATPLSWLYHAVVTLDRWFRPRPVAEAPEHTRVIVVASPVVGGVGKTPIVAVLASALSRQGYNTHIVTTGYKRRTDSDVSIGGRNEWVSAADAGDEAVMLWQMTGTPVHVGNDLSDTISRVALEFGPDFVVLDDGVRRRWSGERRIVVLSAEDLERPVGYLPSGRWRISPHRAWPAAGVAIVQVGQSLARPLDMAICERHERRLRRWGFQGPVGWYVSMADGIERLPGLSADSVDSFRSGPPFVFCGIGSPSRFVRQVGFLGMKPVGVQRFPDHHTYSAADMVDLERQCRQAGARWLLTTHKDAVKIDPGWAMTIPVYWLRIRLELAAGVDMLSVVQEHSE